MRNNSGLTNLTPRGRFCQWQFNTLKSRYEFRGHAAFHSLFPTAYNLQNESACEAMQRCGVQGMHCQAAISMRPVASLAQKKLIAAIGVTLKLHRPISLPCRYGLPRPSNLSVKR